MSEEDMESLKNQVEDLQQQLQKQDKMASLGLLSAGIAHEIQNPLNFVINFSKMSVKLLDDLKDILDRPYDFIDSEKYFSWERFFTALLVDSTKDTYLVYQKNKLNPVYKQDANQKAIVKAANEAAGAEVLKEV